MKTKWMKFLFVAVVMIAPLSLGAVPGDIKIEQNPTAPDTFAVVELPLEKGERASWFVYPKPTIQKDVSTDKVAKLHLNGPAGTEYTVAATIVNFDAKTLVTKYETVKIGGKADPQPNPDPKPNPDPGPSPDPKPNPDPGPAAPVTGFVIVEDTEKPGTWRADLLGSKKVEALYRSLKLTHRVIDIGAESDDILAQTYKDLAKGKELPWLWTLDKSGNVVRDMPLPKTPDKFVEAISRDTSKRALGALLAKPKLKWPVFGESREVPLIPRDQWKEVDYTAFLPPVYDQDGIGQCASSAACTTQEVARAVAGLPYVKLSAGDLYSRVNGGRDQGSLPEDNLEEMMVNGVATAARIPYIWNRKKYSDAATVAERKKYRVAKAYLCTSFDAMMSAIQQGFAIEEAIWWYDNDSTDSQGWLPARGSGSRGGHALHGYGAALRNGTWGIRTRNSWSASWGVGGNCVIPESRFSFEFGAVFAVRSVVQTKEDVTVPEKIGARNRIDVFGDTFALAP